MNFGPKMSESPQFSLVESILRPFLGRICHRTADARPNTAASGRISGQERDFMNFGPEIVWKFDFVHQKQRSTRFVYELHGRRRRLRFASGFRVHESSATAHDDN